jgi:acetyl-CoA synthetase
MTVQSSSAADKVFPVPKRLLDGSVPKPFISSFDDYKKKWEESVTNPDKFFGNVIIFKRVFFISCHILT